MITKEEYNKRQKERELAEINEDYGEEEEDEDEENEGEGEGEDDDEEEDEN